MLNLNTMFIPDEKQSLSNMICKRAKVDTGTTCNAKCDFCYYKSKLNVPFKDKYLIFKEIQLLSIQGITEFDLSGGESSFHPDFFEIIKFARTYGKVTTLSNGMLFNKDFFKRSVDSGLQGILFSLHGWDKRSHNKMTRVNSWDSIINAIHILKNHKLNNDFELRINCTVNNDFDIEYINLINDLKPDQVNLLPLNYWEDAKNLKTIDYNLISKKIKKFIDNLDPGIECNVRYIPFCFMQGYEQYCVGTYQHIFDETDWNIQTYNSNEKKISKKLMFNQASRNRISTYKKTNDCLKCKYLLICDGIEKNLDQQLVAIKGKLIKDINGNKDKDYNTT